MQDKLDQTTVLIEKLQQVQNDRLSAPPPSHLCQILHPTDTELHLGNYLFIFIHIFNLYNQLQVCHKYNSGTEVMT